jgi:hypothetical protein
VFQLGYRPANYSRMELMNTPASKGARDVTQTQPRPRSPAETTAAAADTTASLTLALPVTWAGFLKAVVLHKGRGVARGTAHRPQRLISTAQRLSTPLSRSAAQPLSRSAAQPLSRSTAQHSAPSCVGRCARACRSPASYCSSLCAGCASSSITWSDMRPGLVDAWGRVGGQAGTAAAVRDEGTRQGSRQSQSGGGRVGGWSVSVSVGVGVSVGVSVSVRASVRNGCCETA